MMQYAVMAVVLALMLRGLWDVAMWLDKHLPTWSKVAIDIVILAVTIWGLCV